MEWAVIERAGGREAPAGDLSGCRSGAEDGLSVHLEGQQLVERSKRDIIPSRLLSHWNVWCSGGIVSKSIEVSPPR